MNFNRHMFRYELVVFVVFQWSEIRSHFKWSLEAVYKPSLQNFKHPSVNEFGRGYWTSFEFQLEKKNSQISPKLKLWQTWAYKDIAQAKTRRGRKFYIWTRLLMFVGANFKKQSLPAKNETIVIFVWVLFPNLSKDFVYI